MSLPSYSFLFPLPSSLFRLPSSILLHSIPPLLIIAVHITTHAVVVHVFLHHFPSFLTDFVTVFDHLCDHFYLQKWLILTLFVTYFLQKRSNLTQFLTHRLPLGASQLTLWQSIFSVNGSEKLCDVMLLLYQHNRFKRVG